MTRRMSCSMTIDAVKARSKTVTRRHVDTWMDLKPGDRLTLIEKGMGLPKGAQQVVLAEVEIVGVRLEPIGLLDEIRYGRQEVALEGFGRMDPYEFKWLWIRSHYRSNAYDIDGYAAPMPGRLVCRRIEWRYLDSPVSLPFAANQGEPQ